MVDAPDVWTFDISVTEVADGRVQQLAKAQGTFPVSDAVTLKCGFCGLRCVVERSTFEVSSSRRTSRRPASGCSRCWSWRSDSKKVPEGVSPRTVRLCVFAVAGGMGASGVCVTVLKYIHELIEMLVAYKTVTEAK